MLSEDRKQELMFHIRNKMPVIVCLDKEKTNTTDSIDDMYTLNELEEAGLLVIIDKHQKYVTISVSAPEISLYTGSNTYILKQNHIANFYLINP